MKQTLRNCAALLLFAVPAAALAETTVILNVNVVPMHTNVVLTDQTVMIEDGVIIRIDAVHDVHIPEDVLVIDGTRRYLMPGLAEMHGHVPAAPSPQLDRVFGLYVANGITLVRGMLGQPSHLELRDQLLAQEVLGPRLITSGPSFNGRSVSSPQQAAEMVRDQHAAGYDFLKVHPGMTRDEFDEMARAANEIGIPFAGHVPADVGLDRALASGIATIDHLDGYMQTLIPAHDDPTGGVGGFFGASLASQADESRIKSVAEATQLAGTWNVPTQSLFEHVVANLDVDAMVKWAEMRFMPADTVEQWANSKRSVVADPDYDADVAARAIELRRMLILSLHEVGAGLLLGSDSPQIFNVPGFAIHRELQMLVDSGLSPYEALRTGTVNPAKFFGRYDEWGSVEVGKSADLVLLDENPLEDISATQRVHGVMLRGRWVTAAEITALLDSFER